MKQTVLERCLEKRLMSFGIKLSEREYKDDIELAAAVDDVERPLRHPSSPEERLLQCLFVESPYQESRHSDIPLLFKRVAHKLHRGLMYEVLLKSEMTSTRRKAGQIIARKGYTGELLGFYQLDEELPISNPSYGMFKKGAHVITQILYGPNGRAEIADFEEDIEEYPKHVGWLQEIYHELHGKKVPPTALCSIAANFLSGRTPPKWM